MIDGVYEGEDLVKAGLAQNLTQYSAKRSAGAQKVTSIRLSFEGYQKLGEQLREASRRNGAITGEALRARLREIKGERSDG